jgi:hypothetical protein
VKKKSSPRSRRITVLTEAADRILSSRTSRPHPNVLCPTYNVPSEVTDAPY